MNDHVVVTIGRFQNVHAYGPYPLSVAGRVEREIRKVFGTQGIRVFRLKLSSPQADPPHTVQ